MKHPAADGSIQKEYLQKERDFALKLLAHSAKYPNFRFITKLTQAFNQLINADYTFISKLMDKQTFKTIHVTGNQPAIKNFTFKLNDYIDAKNNKHPYNFYDHKALKTQKLSFPLTAKSIKSYVEIPLYDSNKNLNGVLISLFLKPVDLFFLSDQLMASLQIRAGHEIEKIKNIDNQKPESHNPSIDIEPIYQKLKAQNAALAATKAKLIDRNKNLKYNLNKRVESEERFNFAMKATGDGIWDWDIRKKTMYFSPGWKEMLGYADHELANTYKLWLQFIHPDDVIKAWKMLKKHLAKKRDRFENELRMKHKNGHWITILSRVNAIFDQNKNLIRVVGTHVDITNIKNIEATLRKSENQFRTLAENVPGIIVICKQNPDLEVLYINKQFEKITGNKLKKLQKPIKLSQFIHPDEITRLNVGLNKPVKKKKSFKKEMRLRHKNGNWIWTEFIGATIANENEILIEGVIVDITARKNTELLNNVHLRITTVDNKYNTQQLLNLVLTEAEKITSSQISFFHFINPENQEILLTSWSNQTRKISKIPKRNKPIPIAEAGSWVECINTQKSMVYNHSSKLNHNGNPFGRCKLNRQLTIPIIRNNQVIAILGLGNKETPYNKSDKKFMSQLAEMAMETILRKQSEEKLIEERNRSLNIIDGINAGTWDWSVQTGALLLNKRWAEIIGYRLNELEPISIETWINSVHPDDLDYANMQFEHVFNRDLDHYDMVFRQKHKQGHYVWINAKGKVTKWSKSGKPLLVNGIHMDITQKKENEKTIIQNERRFKSMFYDNKSVMLLINPYNSKIIDFNQAAIDYYGYTADELKMLKISDISTFADNTVKNEMPLGNNPEKTNFQFKHRLKSGVIRNVNVYSSLIKYDNKSLLYSIVQDTEQQHQAKKALKESEKQLQLILDNSPAIMALINQNMEIIRMNKAGLSIANFPDYTEKKCIGDFFHCINADKGCGNSPKCEACAINKTLLKTITFNEPQHKINAQLQVVQNKKIRKYEMLISSIQIINKPDPIYLVTLEDITRQKQFESALAESYIKYKAVADHTYGWEYWKDPQGNYTYISPACERISGYTHDEFYDNPNLFAQRIVEKDQDVWLKHEAFNRNQKKVEKPIEIRFKTKSGKIVWLEHICKPVYSHTNQFIGQRGTNRDITKQKQDQHELIESENRFKQLANINKEGILILKDELIIDANKAIAKMSGYTVKELIGYPVFDKVLNRKLPTSHLDKLKLTQTTIAEIELTNRKGQKYPAEISIRPISKSTKTIRVMSIRDISEQKQIQHKILNAIITTEENERKRVAQDLHDGLGPILSATKLYLETFLKSDNEKFRQKAKEHLLSGIEEALNQVSTISNNLSPHVLIDFGLQSAMNKFIDKVKTLNHIQVTLKFSVRQKVPKDIEITLYRVFTELMNNTLKHANAKQITINVKHYNKYIYMHFENDGIPFDFDKIKKKKSGMGLFNIVNRVKSLNGKVAFISKPNKGIIYKIKIPTIN